jgi:hypothetical protein
VRVQVDGGIAIDHAQACAALLKVGDESHAVSVLRKSA